MDKITLSVITKESVIAFFDWLQETKKCSDATRNSRLAALYSFFRYVQFHHPDHLFEYQRILSVKVEKHKKESLNCLSVDGIRLLLNQPDMTSKKAGVMHHASTASQSFSPTSLGVILILPGVPAIFLQESPCPTMCIVYCVA
jgi:site-specific recombinase XerD